MIMVVGFGKVLQEAKIQKAMVDDNTLFRAFCSACGEEIAGQDPADRSYIK